MNKIRRVSHKFRFQAVHKWLTNIYPQTSAFDIGGGKGLLTHLLNKSGWECVVIDPVVQDLDWKYKDFQTDKQVKLTPAQRATVPKISQKFSKDLVLAHKPKLLIGLHAHGSNIEIINLAKEMGLDFAITPCCVIDEPITKIPGINWINSLFEYAASLNLNPKIANAQFVGQSSIIYTQNHLIK